MPMGHARKSWGAGVRLALLRDRAIQALKAGGIESPARLVDAVLAATRSLAAPGTMAGAALAFSPVEPWPEPVDGADLLGEIERSILRYVVLAAEAAIAMALW